MKIVKLDCMQMMLYLIGTEKMAVNNELRVCFELLIFVQVEWSKLKRMFFFKKKIILFDFN